MPSPSQDTVACTCPSCGNLFAVKTSFLGRQVKCPICASPVTARQEEVIKDETAEQAAVPCRCNVCSNPFAVKLSCIGCQVKCPVCHSTVTATRQEETAAPSPERMPEVPEKTPEIPAQAPKPEASVRQDGAREPSPSASTPTAPLAPLTPQKKMDKRSIAVTGPSIPVPAEPTTKIRKRKEKGDAAPAITAARRASLAQEEPEYQPTAHEADRGERRPTWHIWLFVSGLVLASLGAFMFLRGKDMEAEGSKILNISDRFVDHEAAFSLEVNKDLLAELEKREQRYRLMTHPRKEEDREVESVSAHITAAMNELALYCMAESDEERLNYVMEPEAMRPKMTHWASYGRYKDYLPQEAGKSSKNGDLLQISVLMDDNTVRPAVFLYDRDSGKWKLDWEAWEGFSPMLPAELEAKKPSKPVPVRIALSMPGIYQPPFLEESSAESYRSTAYINFSLEFPNGERLNAYVDRYSPLALELTKLLYNGPVRACVLIHYPADLPGNQSVIIDKLLYSGWMSDATRNLLPTTN
ncbi:MAG: hypothetical protein V8Q21_01740 [Akkermansia muciniphila]